MPDGPLTLRWRPALALGLGLTVAAFAGALFTGDYTTEWYRNLKRPDLLTPQLERAIPFVWGALYLLAGVALAGILAARGATAWKAAAIALLALQLLLNYLYSAVFTIRQDLTGAVQVAAALSAVTAVIVVVCAARRLALPVACLLPYLCWSTFATYLAGEIARLNG